MAEVAECTSWWKPPVRSAETLTGNRIQLRAHARLWGLGRDYAKKQQIFSFPSYEPVQVSSVSRRERECTSRMWSMRERVRDRRGSDGKRASLVGKSR
jgi:hypothetical protein